MIYETKIRDIVKAYKLAHIQLHSEEFLKSWGLTCYGVEIYLSNESENCDYIDVKVTDGGTQIEMNINGTLKVSQTIKEGELPKTIDIEGMLDNALATLTSYGMTKLDPSQWMMESGKTLVRTIKEKLVEFPPEYYAFKAKAELFDGLFTRDQMMFNNK